jgi:septin family protein
MTTGVSLVVHLCQRGCLFYLSCSWKPIVENIESRFDAYLEQENRVNRLKVVDNRVHACLYFIQPTGHS